MRLRNTVLAHEPVAARIVDGDVAPDAREARRRLLPRQPAVADVHRRNSGEAQQRRHGLEMVVAVDEVERCADRVEPIDHRDGLLAQFVGHLAELGAEGDRCMAAREQRGGEVADPDLGARALGEGVVGDQDAEAAHGSSTSTRRRTASASGSKCSRWRSTCA